MLPASEDLIQFVKMLEREGFEYAIGGSVASSLWANPRTTNDVDMTVQIGPADVSRFLDACGDDYIVGRTDIEDAVRFVERPSMFQVLDPDSLFRVDVFVFEGDEYAHSEMQRRRLVELFPNHPMFVLAPENIVLRKLLWYELGNRASDRQWNDLVGVIEVQGPEFDRAYVRDWGAKLGVLELVEEAFGEAREY